MRTRYSALSLAGSLQAVTVGSIAETWKPVPFANRAPSWIFEARAPGYERASAKIDRGGRGREGETACWKTVFLIGQGNDGQAMTKSSRFSICHTF